MTRYLTRKEAADYVRTTHGIPCSSATLAKYACGYGTTQGPPFRKSSKTSLYTKEDLDTWAKARVSPLMVPAQEGGYVERPNLSLATSLELLNELYRRLDRNKELLNDAT